MTQTTAPWYWTYLRYCSNFNSDLADNDSLPFVSCNSFDTFIVSSSILYYQSPNNGGQITNEAVWVASGACFLFFIMKSHCWKNCVYCHHPFVFFVFSSFKLKLCRSYEVNKNPQVIFFFFVVDKIYFLSYCKKDTLISCTNGFRGLPLVFLKLCWKNLDRLVTDGRLLMRLFGLPLVLASC